MATVFERKIAKAYVLDHERNIQCVIHNGLDVLIALYYNLPHLTTNSNIVAVINNNTFLTMQHPICQILSQLPSIDIIGNPVIWMGRGIH